MTDTPFATATKFAILFQRDHFRKGPKAKVWRRYLDSVGADRIPGVLSVGFLPDEPGRKYSYHFETVAEFEETQHELLKFSPRIREALEEYKKRVEELAGTKPLYFLLYEHAINDDLAEYIHLILEDFDHVSE